ncbi:carbohydrate esterase family 15 protein [Tulasnella calospora MUT 4182]|uniref:Carbohydrate esterase family 15 protein n=1 Tax=Tulasnella calospora MUT 4182 TaxID=1051891 RepID=A0A0C3MHD6_9AGAM|nr:carbohydrate esterase family 15 protein [Tulasnella calospora MUT 4182]
MPFIQLSAALKHALHVGTDVKLADEIDFGIFSFWTSLRNDRHNQGGVEDLQYFAALNIGRYSDGEAQLVQVLHAGRWRVEQLMSLKSGLRGGLDQNHVYPRNFLKIGSHWWPSFREWWIVFVNLGLRQSQWTTKSNELVPGGLKHVWWLHSGDDLRGLNEVCCQVGFPARQNGFALLQVLWAFITSRPSPAANLPEDPKFLGRSLL